jgi:hypothetical protein
MHGEAVDAFDVARANGGGKRRRGEFVGHCFLVVAGLVPAIHVFLVRKTVKTWMPGTRPGMTKLAMGAL